LPSEELLLSIYESGSYWNGHQTTRAYEAHVAIQCGLRSSRAIQYVAHSVDQLKILDFGAGRGDMALALAKIPKSIEYYFVEPDQAAADVIRSRETDTCKVREYSNSEKVQFDIIFLNQVMEHVNDPIDLVRDLGHQLSEHGILYVETPFLDHKFKDDVFPHVYFFNRESYQHIASASQLHLKVAKTFGTEDMIQRSFAHKVFALFWMKSIQFRISEPAKWLYEKLYFREQETNPIWVYGIFSRGSNA
jgi:SAM-dependent methyltransferase